MDELLWSLSWSAALRPELPMIPDRRVFLCAAAGRSLTATVEGAPSLLLSLTDICIEHLQDDEDTLSSTAHAVARQHGEDRTPSDACWLDLLAISDASINSI